MGLNGSYDLPTPSSFHQSPAPPAQERHGQIGHQGLTQQGGGNLQSLNHDLLTPSNQPLQPSYAAAVHQQPLTSKPVQLPLDSSSGHPVPLDLSLK